MGEIADMMLDGTLDCETGEYLGDAVGYPRSARTIRSADHSPRPAAPGRSKPSQVAVRLKEFVWLARIARGEGGMYPGMSYRRVPETVGRRLSRLGLITSYAPHNPAHDERWVATPAGNLALSDQGAP